MRFEKSHSVVLVILFAMTSFADTFETCVDSEVLCVCLVGNYTFLPRERALNIKTLIIKDSRLDSQTPNDLSSFSSLNELRLLNSSLKISSQENFSATLSQLEVLYILRSNFTEELVSAILTLAPNVKSLSLEWNKLTRVPKTLFSALQLVESIDISHNAVSEIEPGAFDDLPALTRVDASHNQIGREFDSRVLALPPGCAVCAILKHMQHNCSEKSIRGCKNNAPVDALQTIWNQGAVLRLKGNPVCSQVGLFPLNFENTFAVGTEVVRVGECLFYGFGSCPLHEHRRRFLNAACGRGQHRAQHRTWEYFKDLPDRSGNGRKEYSSRLTDSAKMKYSSPLEESDPLNHTDPLKVASLLQKLYLLKDSVSLKLTPQDDSAPLVDSAPLEDPAPQEDSDLLNDTIPMKESADDHSAPVVDSTPLEAIQRFGAAEGSWGRRSERGVGSGETVYIGDGRYATTRTVWRINWPLVGAVVVFKVLLGCCYGCLRMMGKNSEGQEQHPRTGRSHNLEYGPEPIPLRAP